jgi:signal transduction histidine kinase
MAKPTMKNTNSQKTQKQETLKDKISREIGYLKRGEKHINAEFMGGFWAILTVVILILGLAIMLVLNEIDVTPMLTHKIAKNFAMVFVICVLVGYMLAKGICRRINKPIQLLIKATGKFAEGDLSGRLNKSKYVEFNELVDSYNGMADSIQKLYSTLEHKVQDRTRQLNEAIKELQETQAMMVHSEKMKSLGELVAGIMHEINNPINFIYGNMTHLKNYSEDLFTLIDSFAEYKEDLTPEHRAAFEKLLGDIDYEFLKDDLPQLIKSCHEGTERTKNIILNLKDFSRMEESAITNVDLPKEIDSTLNILNNKFKHGITVKKDYHEDVPKIEAYGGQLNQVFMNILDNAAFAVEGKPDAEVDITIRKDNKYAYVEIADNGKGMNEETKNKIFNPFFTTKPVGQGTGLGLSISYKVIKNHNGIIDVKSEVGKGTTFIIQIPLLFEARNKEEKKDDIEVI